MDDFVITEDDLKIYRISHALARNMPDDVLKAYLIKRKLDKYIAKNVTKYLFN